MEVQHGTTAINWILILRFTAYLIIPLLFKDKDMQIAVIGGNEVGVLRCQIELKDIICRSSELIRLLSRFSNASLV